MNTEILAAILGVLSGVLIERVARSWGRIWCEPSRWEIEYSNDSGRPYPPGEEDRASWVRYDVRIDLFNGKEIPVGLRNARLVFQCAGVEDVVSYPDDRDTERIVEPSDPAVAAFAGRTFYDPLSVINLPPRQFVTKDLFGDFKEKDEVRRAVRWTRVELVGERQRRGPFFSRTVRLTIASRPAFSDPFQRSRAGSRSG